MGPEVGRWSVVSRSVVNIYTSYTDLIILLFRYVGNTVHSFFSMHSVWESSAQGVNNVF